MSFTSTRARTWRRRPVTTMAGLWEIEANIRGQDPATRVKVRQERSAAIVAALFDMWEKELPRLSGKTITRERYFFEQEIATILRAAHAMQGTPRENPKTTAAKRWVPWLAAKIGPPLPSRLGRPAHRTGRAAD